MFKKINFIIVSLLFASSTVYGSSVKSNITQEKQKEISLTIYQNGIALIKEVRSANFKAGLNKLLITDIPNSILTDSVLFHSLDTDNHKIKLIEYYFQFAKISRATLLENSLGKTIQILPRNVLEKKSIAATLLALDTNDVIVKTDTSIFAIDKNRIGFNELPSRIFPHPLLSIKVSSQQNIQREFELSYLAPGFFWDANYTVIIYNDAEHIDLNGLINITNKSGVNIHKGQIRIAQIVNKQEDLFNIARPTNLDQDTSKNISWVSAKNLNVKKNFRIYPRNEIVKNEVGAIMKPQVETWLSVRNTKEKGLGFNLPAGTIKVFQKGLQDNLVFIGENKTESLNSGEDLSLRLGSTNDISAEMHQTDFRKLGNQVVESGYRLDLTNNTKKLQQVTVVQNIPGEWLILRETHTHQKENQQKIKWTLDIPAGNTLSLRYRIRMNVI